MSISRIFDVLAAETFLQNVAFTALWLIWVAASGTKIVLGLVAAIEAELLVHLIEVDRSATAVTAWIVRACISTKTLNKPVFIPVVQLGFWFIFFLVFPLFLCLLFLFLFLLLLLSF